MVEFGQHLMLEVLEQIGRKQPTCLPGIDETVELMDQHRVMVLELGYHRLVQGVQLPRIHHGDQSTCDRGVIPAHALQRLESGSCVLAGLVVVAEGRSTVQLGGQLIVDAIGHIRQNAYGLA